MKIARRALLKASGAVAVIALVARSKAQIPQQTRIAAGSVVALGAITSRTLTYTPGHKGIRAGLIFRSALGLKPKKVSVNASITLKEDASNPFSIQFDGINRWGDGSLRWCEPRGLHPQAFPSR